VRTLLVAIVLSLAAGAAGAQVKYFEYLQIHKGYLGGRANRCYLVGYDINVNQWYGVCNVIDSYDTKGEVQHREIVYWDSTATEKSSRHCDKDCPERPAENLTILDDNGSPISLYSVDTDPTGVMGGNDALGFAMLFYTHPKKFDAFLPLSPPQ
jgi:hypothetical protein